MKSLTQNLEGMREFSDLFEEDLENIRRVIGFCEEAGLDPEFFVHGKAESAEKSSENLDIDLCQVVKTLVFRTGEGYAAVLCPGDKRVSEEKLGGITGGEVGMASPEEVRKVTGYVIGGVSPFDLDIPVYMEEDLLQQDYVKPAAGSRVVGVRVEPGELADAVKARTEDLTC
ncbi:MAG: aminoacyl-tRNA deacylase [Candidatus Nanohalobium sp.]